MAFIRNVTVDITTASDGSATVYSPDISGFIESVKLTLGTLASGATDFTITDESTGRAILTWTNPTDGAAVYPRAAVHSVAGAAGLYASGGEAVRDKIAVAGRIKIVVAQGGDTKAGSLVFTIS